MISVEMPNIEAPAIEAYNPDRTAKFNKILKEVHQNLMNNNIDGLREKLALVFIADLSSQYDELQVEFVEDDGKEKLIKPSESLEKRSQIKIFEKLLNSDVEEEILPTDDNVINVLVSQDFPGSQTGLHIAVSQGNLEICKLLLEYGSIAFHMRKVIDVKDACGLTALHYAANVSKSIEICELLLKYGASIDIGDHDGETALFVAIDQALTDEKAVEMCKFLVTNGANVNVVDKYGFSALDIVLDKEIAEFIIEKGAVSNMTSTLYEQCILKVIDLLNEDELDDVESLLYRLRRLTGSNANTTDARVIGYEGMLKERQESYDEALRLYEEAYQINKTDVVRLHKHARLLEHDHFKAYDQAKVIYEEILAIDPTNTEVLFDMGDLFEKLNDTSNAIAMYEKCLSIDPSHPDSCNNLGILLFKEAKTTNSLDTVNRSIKLLSTTVKQLQRHADRVDKDSKQASGLSLLAAKQLKDKIADGSTPLPNQSAVLPHHCVVCNKEAHSKCGKCKKAEYCSRECQCIHWDSHKQYCGKAFHPHVGAWGCGVCGATCDCFAHPHKKNCNHSTTSFRSTPCDGSDKGMFVCCGQRDVDSSCKSPLSKLLA